jgi:topoisomerase-4 subunit B
MSGLAPGESTHDWSVGVDADHLAAIRNAAGRYSEGGITHLVLEVLAYPLDEAASGTTDRVQVTLHADGSISVEDNGRGTATRYDDAGNPTVKPIMATRDLRFFGVADAPLLPDGRVRSGISVVAAMSEWLTHTNRRAGGRGWVQRYERGLPQGPRTEVASGNTTGTIVHFRPDTTGPASTSPSPGEGPVGRLHRSSTNARRRSLGHVGRGDCPPTLLVASGHEHQHRPSVW